jgi:hypothetical protein
VEIECFLGPWKLRLRTGQQFKIQGEEGNLQRNFKKEEPRKFPVDSTAFPREKI